MRLSSKALVSAVVLTVLGAHAATAMATTDPPDGTVLVALTTPDGVPANVGLAGKVDRVAGKAPAGESASVSLAMPVGAYHVELPSVTFDGVRYVGQASRPEVVVRSGEQSRLDVVYVAEEGARDLHATSITPTVLSLAWSGADTARFSLRRTVDGTPAPHPRAGVEVPVVGTTAEDRGLDPGTEYTYSLFTQDASRWYGPLVVTAGTAPADGSTDASYVAAPTTLLAEAEDIVSVTPTGAGVQLVLQEHLPTPYLGSAIVLPVSATLPGGFLGLVTSLSDDGRTLLLQAGGLSDAFDLYQVSVEDFAAHVEPAESVQPAATAPDTASATAVPPALASCFGGSAGQQISFDPGLDLGGHFKAKISKRSVLGLDIPKGASMDMRMTATVSGALAAKVSGSLNCQVPLKPTLIPLTTSPVPISFYATPNAQLSFGAQLEVGNVGVAVTAGVQFSGHLDFEDGASFSGGPILEAEPLVPKITANGNIGAKLGLQVIVGPGAGSRDVGVIAGVSGELNALDATFGPAVESSHAEWNTCLKTEAKAELLFALTAKAWLGSWDVSKSFTIDGLGVTHQYGGSPWYLPSGCGKSKGGPPPTGPEPEEPGDSVLGEGVTQVSDSLTGLPSQIGYVDGFAPGKNTWVLSTGHMADAVGSPSSFASTSLNQPGDATLSGLAGRSTYDAAGYEVTLVPQHDTLNVRYVFASEEYPEYAGSSYNDVMAVLVDGQNCATLPGTSTPVAINSINHFTNTAYYVDNATGAAGYSTTMDGLTVPLTCSVAVTPGTPVTVRIAVADSSDSIYDSAVALIDEGIWSD